MPPAVPLATYRLQLTPDFGFDAAAAAVPYLQRLGVSHLYASPLLKARAGSRHGYDVVDYDVLNPELGGEAAFERLSAALSRADIGLILDFVPNHMAIHYADNAWWLDVLEWGTASARAAAFDIDWGSLPGPPRVLLPILGAPYGEAIDRGEIALRFDAAQGSFSAWYFEHRLPIAPSCYAEILRTVMAAADLQPEAGALAAMIDYPAGTPAQASKLKAALAALPGAADAIGQGLRAYAPQDAKAAPALLRLLERQHYRPAHWRLAASAINYRRFFDISSLAGLRVGDPGTFAAVHTCIERLIAAGRLHGLRIDHVDGLSDPHQYFRRLRERLEILQPQTSRSFYIVVEKILAEAESLPDFAGVAGTTGYEWLNLFSRVMLDERGLTTLTRTWQETSGDPRSFAQLLIEAKRDVMADILVSELAALLRLLAAIADAHYGSRDFAAGRLRAALELFILHFPVYRTYVSAAAATVEDRAIIESTLVKARQGWVGEDEHIFDFLRAALTLDLPPACDAVAVRRFAFKVQQFTGPMMAKSLEDTAFYRYHRLLALNEVGGDPALGAISTAQFHARMQARAATPTQGLTATATHDTKRGEDARTRLLALTELAEDWTQHVRTWRRLNAALVDRSAGAPIPSAAHEYMLYQALLGAWPLGGVEKAFVERMVAYAVKAAREGKQQTSWLAPNQAYETGLEDFLLRMLDPRRSQQFLESFAAFAGRAALVGALKSLVQVALKITVPGIPDFYQGAELWDLSLVDPDNRRAVDLEGRAALLRSLDRTINWLELIHAWPDGRIKFVLTRRLLEVRREFGKLFADGAYQPFEVAGRDQNEIISFARASGQNAIVVICSRSFSRATDGGRRWPGGADWQATVTLSGFSEIEDLLGGTKRIAGPRLFLSEVFDALPIAILQARRHGPQQQPDSLRSRQLPSAPQ